MLWSSSTSFYYYALLFFLLRAIPSVESYCRSCYGRSRFSCSYADGCYWISNRCSGFAQCNDGGNDFTVPPAEPTQKCYAAKCDGIPTIDPCIPAFANLTEKTPLNCAKAVNPYGICSTLDSNDPLNTSNLNCTIPSYACSRLELIYPHKAACTDLGCKWTDAYCDDPSTAFSIRGKATAVLGILPLVTAVTMAYFS